MKKLLILLLFIPLLYGGCCEDIDDLTWRGHNRISLEDMQTAIDVAYGLCPYQPPMMVCRHRVQKALRIAWAYNDGAVNAGIARIKHFAGGGHKCVYVESGGTTYLLDGKPHKYLNGKALTVKEFNKKFAGKSKFDYKIKYKPSKPENQR